MASTLFSFCITDGEDDSLLGVLDAVYDAGVADSEWRWVTWRDVQGRIFAVVKGSLAARGIFQTHESVRPIRLSVAVRHSEDNRSTWDEPDSATEGRDILAEWVRDSGIEVLDHEVIEAALPRPAAGPSPMILQGRERLERSAVKIESGSTAWGERPSSGTKKKSGKDWTKHNAQRRPSGRRTEGSTNSVLAAFASTLAGSTDSTGAKFSLYRLEGDADDAGQG